MRHGSAGSQLLSLARSPEYRAWIKEADALYLTQKQKLRPVTLGYHMVHMVFDARRRRADGHNLMKGVLDWLQRVEIIHNDKDTALWAGEWGRSDGCSVRVSGEPYVREADRRVQPVRQPRAKAR